MRDSHQIVKSTSLLSLITIFSLGFGFLKEIVVADYFGAGEEVDAFLVASIVPLAFPRILTIIISLSFIPAYLEAWNRDKEQARNLLNFVLTSMLAVFLIGSLFFYWRAPELISRLAPGFQEQSLSLATVLMRMMLPILFFYGLFCLSTSLLNARRIFTIPGISVIIPPLCVIAVIVFFRDQMGVVSWGVGLTIGYALQAALLMILIISMGIRPGLRVNLRDPGISSFLKSAFPLLCATAINTLILVIDRAMASELAPGSISALSYADKIFEVPLQAFILSIATVILPFASAQFLEADKSHFKKTIQLSILMAAFVLLPITAGLVVLSKPLVTVLFQRGAFDLQDSLVTSQALIGYSCGFFSVAIYYILQRILIVVRRTTLLIVIAVANVALKVVLNLVCIELLDAAGVAVATTVMYVLTSSLMFFMVYRLVNGFEIRPLIRTISKIGLATLVMGGAGLISLSACIHLLPGQTLDVQIMQLAIVILISSAVYALAIWAVKIQQAKKIYGLLAQLIPFRKNGRRISGPTGLQ